MEIDRKPVEITIEDNRRFQDVAFLVDLDSFLEDIKSVRNILDITKANPDFFRDWKHANRFKELPENVFEKLDQRYSLKYQRDKIYSKNHPYTAVDALKDISVFLCSKYKKSSNFIPVIQAAIGRNEVKEEDYETAFLSLFSPTVITEKNLKYVPKEERELFKVPRKTDLLIKIPQEPGFILYFSYNSSAEYLQKILDMNLKQLRNAYKAYNQKWDQVYPQEDYTISNIQRDRQWYWLYRSLIKEKSTGNIYDLVAKEYLIKKNINSAKGENQLYAHDISETIRKALDQYNKRLSLYRKLSSN